MNCCNQSSIARHILQGFCAGCIFRKQSSAAEQADSLHRWQHIAPRPSRLALALHSLAKMEKCARAQVLLEATLASGSTKDLQVTYPDLNKHIEDPLSLTRRHGSKPHHRQYAPTLLEQSGRQHSGAVHVSAIEVPHEMRDQQLDLSRWVLLFHAWLLGPIPDMIA
jgi:hypothetical protein